MLYGEGAVANAARLLRSAEVYRPAVGEAFVAANYPPLYFAATALGDGFAAGRLVSLAAVSVVAGLVYRRARHAGRLRALALAAAWLASVPVLTWAPAVKPDLLAVALAAGAVVALDGRRPALAGALLGLALFTKQTEVIVALALAGYLAATDRPALRRMLGGLAAVLCAGALASLPLGVADVWRHVLTWNALAWDPAQAALMVLVAAIVAGVPALLGASASGPVRAYLVAAFGIVILGGREGASLNYCLDLAAAAMLALAVRAEPGRRGEVSAVAVAAQLLLALVLVDPFGVSPLHGPQTGHWGDPARVAALGEALRGGESALVEDSGLLVALGRTPVVDDLFLWSRLVARGQLDEGPLVRAVAERRFALVVAETDLDRIASAAAYERARWSPGLLAALRSSYALDGTRAGLWFYRPRTAGAG